MGVTLDQFHQNGWCRFEQDPALLTWLQNATGPALATRHDPDMAKAWLCCQGTWFVGVNALANDGQGVVGNSGPLNGKAMTFIRQELGFGDIELDPAQVSICYPGYPKPREGESDAAFRFRRDRAAAHLDGVHLDRPTKARKIEEFQGFLLGVPVTETNDRAAPLVVWENSHRIMQAAFQECLKDHPVESWHQLDLQVPYQRARKQVFEECTRIAVHAKPGEAYLLHRFSIHGISPWLGGAEAPTEGRAILYFRPETDRETWLNGD